MTTQSVSQNEDGILLILEELNDAKASLKQVSQQMQRVERRIKAALPKQTVERLKAKDRLDLNAVSQTVENLRQMATKGGDIEKQLIRYSVKPELQKIASELGMTNDRLPTKDDLVRRIATRLRQGASVSSGIRSPG